MAVITEDNIKRIILEKYNIAKNSVIKLEKSAEYAAVSNRIPNYDAEKMDFGTYNKNHFVALFADMRGSSRRAEEIGPIGTFLTIHTLMPGLIYIVENYGGYVIDLPGDGIMALFKENRKRIQWSVSKEYLNPEELAFSAGEDILTLMLNVVNGILNNDNIPPVKFGVGIDSGECIVTKTGIDSIFDTKAIGTCINNAAKRSGGDNEIWISENTTSKLQNGLKNKLTKNNGQPWFYKKY
ncbi:adenylate/guanylate cyclase domain-containing protein [Rossellomorea sp. NRS-1567]|uniref:adenylate/guanylate cyclase domain-containing protein n=1 Tax=Rossellomorea sp. NRS-1567 TaxID=3233901 RepID=UPI003D2D3399